MQARILKDKTLNLPDDCQIWVYSPDTMVLVGPEMNRDSYKRIRSDLPACIQTSLIGFRRVGKLPA